MLGHDQLASFGVFRQIAFGQGAQGVGGAVQGFTQGQQVEKVRGVGDAAASSIPLSFSLYRTSCGHGGNVV
jgi:hypothetical protein